MASRMSLAQMINSAVCSLRIASGSKRGEAGEVSMTLCVSCFTAFLSCADFSFRDSQDDGIFCVLRNSTHSLRDTQ